MNTLTIVGASIYVVAIWLLSSALHTIYRAVREQSTRKRRLGLDGVLFQPKSHRTIAYRILTAMLLGAIGTQLYAAGVGLRTQATKANFPGNQEFQLGSAVLKAAVRANKARLRDMMWLDEREIAEVRKRVGDSRHWKPTPAEIEEMDGNIQVFLASYRELFDGTPVSIATQALDLRGSSTPESSDAGEVLMKELHPERVIIWVKKGDEFRGIVISSVLHTHFGLKVGEWVMDNPVSSEQYGKLTRRTAKLVRHEARNCNFPNNIQYEEERTAGGAFSH